MAVTSLPRTSATTLSRNPASPWRHLDHTLVGAALAAACLGTVMVFSATRSVAEEAGYTPTTFLQRQLLFLALGVGAMVVTTLVDYRRLRRLAPAAYLGAVGLLVAVLSPLGTEVNGSQSWFSLGPFQLQPAELAKLAVIGVLASHCAAVQARGGLSGSRVLVCLALAGVPSGLIFLQPDVGSMLVFVAIVMGVLLVGGARPRHIVALALAGVVGVIAMLSYTDLVEGYQKERLTSFANEGQDDSQGASFQIDQSKTAIGAGGLTGAGLFNGTQTKLRYVPEQQTDFIFTVVGEELGFAGSATLLGLYALMVWRIWRAAQVARDTLGVLLCTGVMALLVFQIFENMGMTMGIMPITGIPLPFLSYGGSSLITTFAAIGLVLNVGARRFAR